MDNLDYAIMILNELENKYNVTICSDKDGNIYVTDDNGNKRYLED